MSVFSRKFKFAASAALLGCFAALSACGPNGQNQAEGEILPNDFGKAAVQMGVKACAPLFSVLGQTLIANSEYSAKLIPDKNNADAHGLTGLVGQYYPGDEGKSKGAGIIYAAPLQNGCEGMLVRTLLIQHSCADIAAKQLPQGAKRQEDLAQTPLFALPDGGYVMMVPASEQSCVVTLAMNLRSKAE